MADPLHSLPPMRRSAGFTMIEMMMVVVVIAILTVVAVVGYTRIFRKARSTEVVQIFGELKARESAYHAETGKFVPVCASAVGATADSDCLEGSNDYWPTPLVGKGNQTDAGSPPIRWQTLHVQIPTGGLYCQYQVIAGLAGDNTAMGATGVAIFGATAPIRNWFYVMGQCDWDGDPLVNALYWQRDDLTELGKSNEQN